MGALTGVLAGAITLIMAIKPGIISEAEAETLKTNIPVAVTAAVSVLTCILAAIGRFKATKTLK